MICGACRDQGDASRKALVDISVTRPYIFCMKAMLFSILALSTIFQASAAAPYFRNLDGTPASAGNALSDDDRIRKVDTPVVRVFLTENKSSQGRILLLPGGGYSILSAIKEGEKTAKLLNTFGYDVGILEYRVSAGPKTRDLALEDSLAALKIIVHKPEAYGLRGKRSGIMGYSAGGHLAARTLMGLPADQQPDDIILIYPAYLDETEKESGKRLITPPAKIKTRAFVLIASNDRPLWVTSSREFCEAWDASGGESVFHLLPDGGHGFGMNEPLQGAAATWPGLLKDFLLPVTSVK